eukprot:2774432-Rhodomonas_salina.2
MYCPVVCPRWRGLRLDELFLGRVCLCCKVSVRIRAKGRCRSGARVRTEGRCRARKIFNSDAGEFAALARQNRSATPW